MIRRLTDARMSSDVRVPDGRGGPEDVPLLSLEDLRELEDEVGDPAAYLGFVRRYVELWPHRYARLADAIAGGSHDSAMDAVLSLKTSSQMVGARRLYRLTLTIQDNIRNKNLSGLERLLETLFICGNWTMTHLSREVRVATDTTGLGPCQRC